MTNEEVIKLIEETCKDAIRISNFSADAKKQPQYQKDLVTGCLKAYRDMMLS